jgi:CTP synthase
MDDWEELVRRIRNPDQEVTIAVVGKYIEHRDAYKSIYEALDHAGFAHSTRVIVKRIEAEELEATDAASVLAGVDGLLVPGGFGMRGVEGKIQAAHYAREHNLPYFGICLGMQIAVIEFARNVLGHPEANSTEFDGNTPDPVICLLEDQKTVREKGGTMRLGAQPCDLAEDSLAARTYGQSSVSERHRHRYEFNPKYRQEMADAGLVVSGQSPDGKLAEIVEIPDHPWFLAVQFHPEFKSKPNLPHPLFHSFIEAALQRYSERTAATV